MPIFKYLSFVCEADQLEARLNEYGAQGWRLHTCEPVATVGPSGSGVLNAFVVLDMMLAEPEDEPADVPVVEGIPMKG